MIRPICLLAIACLVMSVPALAAPDHETDRQATAQLDHAEWLVGRWVGVGMGGDVEEVWSPAVGGQMIGHFRYSKNGNPGFYEILMIDRTADGIRMRVKHFNPDFSAWEDKQEWVEFEPISTTPNQLKFNGLLLDHRVEGEKELMIATLRMRQKDGAVSNVVFTFEKAR